MTEGVEKKDLSRLYANMRKIEDERNAYINDMFHKVNDLEHLSGYSIDMLISLFAAGFKLTAPPPGQKLGDLFRKEIENERV